VTECHVWPLVIAAVAPTITSIAALVLAVRTHLQVTTVKNIVNGHDRDG
jgi:hypothetical protein